MIEKVFNISGNKISSFFAGDKSLMFSSQSFSSVEKFLEAWNKKLSLATKLEIKFNSIKSIRKEDNEENIIINYTGLIGLPSQCEFSFRNREDYQTFFDYLEKDRFYTKSYEALTPFKAIRNYIIGLLITIGISIFSYYEAINIANGTVVEPTSGKSRLFNSIIGFLGDKGVLLVGGLATCYILYKTWTRFVNPPNRLNFSPPNA